MAGSSTDPITLATTEFNGWRLQLTATPITAAVRPPANGSKPPAGHPAGKRSATPDPHRCSACATPVARSRYPNTQLYYCDSCWFQLDCVAKGALITESIKLACYMGTIPDKKPKKDDKKKDGDNGDTTDAKDKNGDNGDRDNDKKDGDNGDKTDNNKKGG